MFALFRFFGFICDCFGLLHFILGVNPEATEKNLVQSKFNISCTGTIGKGKTSLDINVKIDGETVLGSLLRLGKEKPPPGMTFSIPRAGEAQPTAKGKLAVGEPPG